MAVANSPLKSVKKFLLFKAMILAIQWLHSVKRFILSYLPPTATCLKFLTPLLIKGDEIAAEKNTRETKEKTRAILANQEEEL